MNISAGRENKNQKEDNKKKDREIVAGIILLSGIMVLIVGIGSSILNSITFDATKLVFGDINNVKNQHITPMAKVNTNQPPQPDQPNENQPQPQIMEHIPEKKVNNGEYYQYRDKNGVISFTDNKSSIPPGAEAKNWNGLPTGEEFEIIKGKGRETPIIVEKDRVYVPVKIRSAGIERDLLLLLDTGATSVVIYQDEASGIRLNNIKNGSATLANGSQVQQLVGTVDLVSVGQAVARNFEIRIMQQIGQKDHQGLLGMNFLKNFHYTLDMNRKIIRWN